MSSLTPTAEKIFRLKYSRNGTETWEEACARVAHYVSMGDSDLLNTFFNMIYEKAFLPGGRILANAGTNIKNLNNCFVLPIDDSRDSIYNTLKEAAEVFAWGGGIGYNFSNIREEGAPVQTTGGKASGPLSFMSLFDQTGEVISQASRRGAQMGMLDVDHPDIMKFIGFKNNLNSRNARLLGEYKRNLERVGLDKKGTKYFDTLEKTLADDQLTHFNISVVLNDDFISAVLEGRNWELKSRVDDETWSVPAIDILEAIANQSWTSGDPGVAFYNRINEDNLVPYLGNLNCSNPCGEIFLLPYEPCCLGSINLMAVYDEEKETIDLEFLEYLVRNAVIFLDNVQTLSETPIENINYWSKSLRRLGLGVMGWADLLAKMNIPYNSIEALELAKRLSWFISYFGHLQSMALAVERGPFDLYDPDKVNLDYIMKLLNSEYSPREFTEEEVRKIGFRNVAITSIAPTGTIALLAGVNSSIEPFFALAYKRHITEGVGNTAKDTVIEINTILFKKLEEAGYSDEQIEVISEYVQKNGTLKDCPEIFEFDIRPFIVASELSPEDHLLMQAAWQQYVDNSISKTINMPNESTVDEIANVIISAWNLDLKGVTIYRNNSKLFQILNIGTD